MASEDTAPNESVSFSVDPFSKGPGSIPEHSEVQTDTSPNTSGNQPSGGFGFFKGSGFGATIANQVPPRNFNANRRTSVSAEALNPNDFKDDWKPPVHQLTQQQLQRLNDSAVKNFLFAQLDPESLRTVIFALEEKRVPKDTEIIKQGDQGDYFYVVEKGTVNYYVNNKEVNTSSDGSSFGELALMYNAPRAATVIAKTDCILWALDRMTFRRILLERTSKKRSLYDSFLKEVPVLKSLSSYERSKLADALNTESYQIGQNVVTQGAEGENFYFIEDGDADVIKDDKVVQHLRKGDYFGELALLYDSPRQATVKATTLLKVVTLGKSGFQRLLGPAVDVLKLQDPTKHSN
ncbi:DEKNAAC102794 [Brettanomyces naardenensis]|uniref:cAMP-dependent protein kinase regulatory subunit n=1 Tax=Brettanomyces naardenensis TaxID=13370 RepID=A0A448YK91_BRENA|nr:DEKNAAC102794 [Brettanomyces naardenensis]